MDGTDLNHRFAFHAADTQQKRDGHEAIREDCLLLARKINALVPDGRELSLAITNLEQTMMWANAGLARSGDVLP